jgi:peptide-methionine (S)-S-oxide reductase
LQIAEAIEITFDPETISNRRILEYFFQIHDPTTRNRQGNDVGSSYRSAIYYVDDEQKRVAEDIIADVNASGLWSGKAETEVESVGDFWQAEPKHQDYLSAMPTATPPFPASRLSAVPAGRGCIASRPLRPPRFLSHRSR